MAAPYRKLEIKRFPKPQTAALSEEVRFWKQFKFPIIYQHFAGVTHVDFSPTEPHQYAITSSTRVHIYDPLTHNQTKTVSRFKDIAYSGSFKSDGKLLVAGGESGLVQVFDLASRAILRTFKGHTAAVHVTKFSPNNINVMSAGDDKVVSCWDVPTEQKVVSLSGHNDYIRTGTINPSIPDVWVTGGYDHMVKIWDLRSGECSMNLDHGAPVEALLMFRTGGVVISAGGNYLKVWDLLGGSTTALNTISNHQKTITSLSFDGTGERLLSGSLDHQIKIYNTTDYEVVHSAKYPAPILSFGVSPDNTHLVVGMSDGLLSIRHRVVNMTDQVKKEKRSVKKGPKSQTARSFFDSKADSEGNVQRGNYHISRGIVIKLSSFDRFLKAFRYKAALDAVLETHHANLVSAMIEELIRREGLVTAISGRDDTTLAPLVNFILHNITNPRYSSLLITTTHKVLDIYSPVIGQSDVIDELLLKLKEKLDREISYQKELIQLTGALDVILTAATDKPKPFEK